MPSLRFKTAVVIFQVLGASLACRTGPTHPHSADTGPPITKAHDDRLERATAGLRFGDWRVSVVNRLSRPSRSNAIAAYDHGMALLSENQRFAAARRFADAVLADPDFAYAYDGIGQALWRRGAVSEAMDAFQTAIDRDPGLLVAYEHLATALAAEARFAEAVDVWQALLERDPVYDPAHARMAVAYYYTGDFASAWRHVETARTLKQYVPPQLLALLEKQSSDSR